MLNFKIKSLDEFILHDCLAVCPTAVRCYMCKEVRYSGRAKCMDHASHAIQHMYTCIHVYRITCPHDE